MAAYIIDAAVCHSLQTAAVQSTSGCACFDEPFYRIRRRIAISHCGFFDRLKGERVVRPPFCVDSAPAGMRHIRAMRPPRKELSGAHCRIERSYRGGRRGLLRKARCRASPLRAAVRCLRSFSRRRFDRARKRDAARQGCEKGIFMKTAGTGDAHPPPRRGLLRKARCRALPLRAVVRCLRSFSRRRFARAHGSGTRRARWGCEKGIFTKTAEAGDAHPPPRRGLLRKARCRASPL